MKYTILILILLGIIECQAQNNKEEKTMNNQLLCDPQDGFCAIPMQGVTSEQVTKTKIKKLKIIYFTDPICSSCWGIEPQLRKLKLEYGNSIDIEYRMGGLLPDWSYNSGGISKPSDVAHHWDEVSIYYDMPIDGDVWLEDPLHSSYPPSIAFKAAQMQDNQKAILFLREIREMVFLQKKNITKWEHLENAANKVGLNIQQLKIDYDGRAKVLFEEDLQIARKYGVRGFPTMIFINPEEQMETVYGSKAYKFYENAILKLDAKTDRNEYNKSWEALFSKYNSLTLKEFSELSNLSKAESEKLLNELVEKKELEKFTTKNGSIWKKR